MTNQLTTTTTFALGVCAFFASFALAQKTETKVEWNRFRGPDGTGVHLTSKAPLEWGDNKNIQWKCPLPGYGTSSPIVSGDRVFLTAHSAESVGNSGFEKYLLCIDRNSGQKLWSRKIKRTTAKANEYFEPRAPLYGYASSTPATDGKHVYVSFGADGMFAFDMQGNQVWHHRTEIEGHVPAGVSSPIVFRDMVILNEGLFNGTLIAVNKLTGQKKWEFKDPKLKWSSALPLIAKNSDKQELVVQMEVTLVGLDLDTGEQIWNSNPKIHTDGRETLGPMLDSNSGEIVAFPAVYVVVLPSIRAGEVDATIIEDVGADDHLTPIIADNQVLILLNGGKEEGYVDVVSLSGRQKIQEKKLLGDHEFIASPIRIRDFWVALSTTGKAFVFSTGKDSAESIESTCQLNESSPRFVATPAVTEDQLLLRSDRFLYSISSLPASDTNVNSVDDIGVKFGFSAEEEAKLLGMQSLEEKGHRLSGQSKYAEAINLAEQVVKIREQVLGHSHFRVADTRIHLGQLFIKAGDLDQAEQNYLIAKQILESLDLKNTRAYNGILTQLIEWYSKSNDIARCEPLLLEKLRTTKSFAYANEIVAVSGILDELSTLSMRMEKFTNAIRYCEQNQKASCAHLKSYLPTLPESGRQRYVNYLSAGNFRRALSVGYYTRSTQRGATLSAGWLLNMKGVVQEASAEAALLSTPDAAELVQELQAVRTQLAELSLNSTANASKATKIKVVELENAERGINKKLAEFRIADIDVPWINIGQIRGNLPLGSVMINFAKFKRRNFQKSSNYTSGYAAWIIPASGEGEVKMIHLGSAKTIETAITALRKQLDANVAEQISKKGEGALEQEFIRQSKQISQLVFAPLEKHLSDVEEIIISPDAELWTIPWEALRTVDEKYILEKYRVRYLTTGRELAYAKRSVKFASPPIVMADPDYDLSTDKIDAVDERNKQVLRSTAAATFTRLPSSRIEASAIKSPLESYTGSTAQMLLGVEAQESAFKQLHRPRSLVLSTHGYFDKYEVKESGRIDANPLLRCGLALAGANNRQKAMEDGKEDGILTGLEIVGTDLRGTELVVLSACETGLGEVTSGEGVAGLRQAFQLAGAQSVVSSLWQVEDGETARLMKLFFQNLADGKSKSEAIRQAQLSRIKARRARHGAAHPFFWAAFTLTGQD